MLAKLRTFAKFRGKTAKDSAIFNGNFEIRERCKGVHCVDLGESFLTSESFPTSIYLQKFASIQPRTSSEVSELVSPAFRGSTFGAIESTGVVCCGVFKCINLSREAVGADLEVPEPAAQRHKARDLDSTTASPRKRKSSNRRLRRGSMPINANEHIS